MTAGGSSKSCMNSFTGECFQDKHEYENYYER